MTGSFKLEITDADFAMLDKCMHRLMRIRDYSCPNHSMALGGAPANDDARDSLGSITNQLIDYVGGEGPARVRMSESAIGAIHYFLKESDRFLREGERHAWAGYEIPALAPKFKELMERVERRVPDKSFKPAPQAELEMKRLTNHYSARDDAGYFLDNAPVTATTMPNAAVDKTDIVVPGSLETVHFTPERLHDMLSAAASPEALDFRHSADLLIAAVEKNSSDDAAIVRNVFARSGREPAPGKPFNVDWGDDWDRIGFAATELIRRTWAEVHKAMKAAQEHMDTPRALIKMLRDPEKQKNFVSHSIRRASDDMRQNGP